MTTLDLPRLARRPQIARLLMLVALAQGCYRWTPAAPGEWYDRPQELVGERLRVTHPEGFGEIVVHRVAGASIDGTEVGTGTEWHLNLGDAVRVERQQIDGPRTALVAVGLTLGITLTALGVFLASSPFHESPHHESSSCWLCFPIL